MMEINYGQLDKRQITIRLFRQHLKYFRFPWWTYHRNMNHRCYCPCGSMLDFGASIFGFGFIVFYSRYAGPTPCVCDEVIAEMFPEDEE